MSLGVFWTVLFAAMLHASWNAVVKQGSDKLLTTVLLTSFGALLSLPWLPLLPLPAGASWPWLGLSVVLQVAYYLLIARTYQTGEMSLSYPLMRGVAPLLVAMAGNVLFAQSLPAASWAAIGLICGGILLLAIGKQPRGMLLPLGIACLIATYTLVDAHGVRLSGTALGYSLWLFVLSALPLLLWALLARRPQLQALARQQWRQGLFAGFGFTASYAIALWAMTQAPVAMVSALRETSILFALLISTIWLKEQVSIQRLLSAGLIIGGVVMLRLG